MTEQTKEPEKNKDEFKEIVKEAFKEKTIKPPGEEIPKEKGLTTEIKELNEKLAILTKEKESKFKKKSFKFPAKVKKQIRNLKKLSEKNKIQVILLKANRTIQPTGGEMKEGMLILGNKIHDGKGDIVWMWMGKTPTAIVPEWDLMPLTRYILTKSTEELKSLIHPQTILIRAMEFKEAMMQKAGFSGKMIIWILLGAVAVGYVLFNNQGGT